jgi:malonyl-CoA/methylmalonyl-CoA synthetase
VTGVEVKLVDGEMRLKSPSMFSRYEPCHLPLLSRISHRKRYICDDPTQTEKAFDSEGFFRTGDCAEKLGDSYILYGRVNIDGHNPSLRL